jgi:hypothetical protein
MVFMASMTTMVMFVHLFLVGLFGLFAAFLDDLDVIVKNSSYDWHHISFDNTSPHVFGSSDANIDHALESKVPFPHSHHILTPSLLQYADEAFDASINC